MSGLIAARGNIEPDVGPESRHLGTQSRATGAEKLFSMGVDVLDAELKAQSRHVVTGAELGPEQRNQYLGGVPFTGPSPIKIPNW